MLKAKSCLFVAEAEEGSNRGRRRSRCPLPARSLCPLRLSRYDMGKASPDIFLI